MEQRYGLTSIS